MAETVVESIVINAPAEDIYDLVADVRRMGEWSPEATGAYGAAGVMNEGDVFIGRNRRGPVVWVTRCKVVRAQRGQRFEFTVDVGPFPVSTWVYELTPEGEGTRVTETWIDEREGLRGLAVKAVGQLLIPGNRPQHNRANMVQTLRRLKQAAESTSA